MITGMSPFTLFHVVLSFMGILSGFVVLFGLLTAIRLDGWTAIFFTSTVLTSMTGFLFPFHRLLPSHILGVLSLILLVVTIYACYSRKLAGAWSSTCAVTAVLALYFNVFVLIAQLFQKVQRLKAVLSLAPSDPSYV